MVGLSRVGRYIMTMALNLYKIFSLVPSKKPVARENWDKLSVYFSILNDEIDKKHQFCQIAKCQMAFFGMTENFIIQKLKSKQLVCLSFLWWQGFLREWEKISYTYSRPYTSESISRDNNQSR